MRKTIDDLITRSALESPGSPALGLGEDALSYEELDQGVSQFAGGLGWLGLKTGDRVAVWLPKRFECVLALFGASRAGGIMVPLNPGLKARQAHHILKDSGTSVLVTNRSRLEMIRATIAELPELAHVILIDETTDEAPEGPISFHPWGTVMGAQARTVRPPSLESEPAAILYTSGSTGLAKGVVVSHRNMTVGAESVSDYLALGPEDRLLAVLPFSFDYGLSQLTISFHVGAFVQMMDYLFPKDILGEIEFHGITGLAGVPPLWFDLARLDWPEEASQSLRFITNSGGAMAPSVTEQLRRRLPQTDFYLMYGLTEAFRSTYLAPEKVATKPTSVGQAIPNADVMILRPDGRECAPGEQGELVHRGPLVALGYWGDRTRTEARFRPLPPRPGLVFPEIAVWSGDQAWRDEEGDIFFVGREDEMIKTSGYRVSPGEVEQAVLASGLVHEVVASSRTDEKLGQVIVIHVSPLTGQNAEAFDRRKLLMHCRAEMPSYMVPTKIRVLDQLPRNANGKLDRALLGRMAEDEGE